jgi:hypothetical protein
MSVFYVKVKSIKVGKVMANALMLGAKNLWLGELFPFGQKLDKK